VEIAIGGETFGHSVDSRVSVEMLQKIAENATQTTLSVYWVPIVTEWEGYIGCLCPHDKILMYPGTQSDIDRINQPRTTAASGTPPAPRRNLTPASTETNSMARQSSRESYVPWGDIAALLEIDKYVHVITDGGSNPVPGPAGCGAANHQNGRFSLNSGHCSNATNNAMELKETGCCEPNPAAGIVDRC
jgi:hypothetical protein